MVYLLKMVIFYSHVSLPQCILDNDDNVIPEVIINEVSNAAAQLMRASHHLMLHFHVLEFHRTMKST